MAIWLESGCHLNLGRFICHKSRKISTPNRCNGLHLVPKMDIVPHEGFIWNIRHSVVELQQ